MFLLALNFFPAEVFCDLLIENALSSLLQALDLSITILTSFPPLNLLQPPESLCQPQAPQHAFAPQSSLILFSNIFSGLSLSLTCWWNTTLFPCFTFLHSSNLFSLNIYTYNLFIHIFVTVPLEFKLHDRRHCVNFCTAATKQ